MKLIIVGFGGVAARFAELLLKRRIELRERYRSDLRVVGAADSRSCVVNERGLDLEKVLHLKKRKGMVSLDGRPSPDIPSFIRETDADTMIELTPTNHRDGEPGLGHFRAAMKSGKHVVTANKGPLATAYQEVTSLARKQGVQLLFGAAVGGGNPVLQFGEVCASAEPVLAAEAIVNRTSTYILSQIETAGLDFARVLRQTQESGLAEPDPSMDVDGLDTACKIVIISNHVLGRSARFGDVHPIESIRGITVEKTKDAKKRGRRIRMVGRAGDRLSVKVEELDADDPLAVSGTSDMTRYHCKYSGPKLVGSTAGGPDITAMGLLRDLMRIGGREST